MFLVLGLAAGGAEAKAGGRPDPFELYADAFSSSRIGFSCTPAAVPNGPAVPDYDRMRRALARRLGRVAERLSILTDPSRIDALEQEIVDEEHGVYRTGCDLEETRQARLHYGRVLRQLEHLLWPEPSGRR
jgi:hypothetical protein